MDVVWYRRVADALTGANTDAEVFAAVQSALDDGSVAAWRPGRVGWDHVAGPSREAPADSPSEEGVEPHGTGVLVRVGSDPSASRLLLLEAGSRSAEELRFVAELTRVAVGRLVEREVADAARQRLTDNERIGQLGSYDWHIPTDTNRWSDQLYRIYGEAPQSFNASYERFIGFIHPDDRERVQGIHQEAMETGEPYEMEERIILADGTQRLLWSNGEVIAGPDGTPERFIGICRDVTEQRRAEVAAAEAERHQQAVHDAEIRRRAALELNDSIVQGITAAIWSADIGAPEVVKDILAATLESARSMMDDLLSSPGSQGAPSAGELRRGAPSRVHMEATQEATLRTAAAPPATETVEAPNLAGRSVVLADDSADVRLMVSVQLRFAGMTIVAEATNGIEAVDAVAATAPDIVLLDLSMPELDGLEAARRIRAAHPDVTIIVLSGYAASTMASRAREAGADGYIEKGGDLVAQLDRELSLVGA